MTRFVVVRNEEEQYSLWPEHLLVPGGWVADGFVGDREACLAHVEEVWRDMTPASLRRG